MINLKQAKAMLDAGVPASIFVSFYKPTGKLRKCPLCKPSVEWTAEERHAYEEYIRKTRSKAGGMGGRPTHKKHGDRPPSMGRAKATTLLCHVEDHAVIAECSRAAGVSIPALLHEFAQSLQTDSRYAHLFVEPAPTPQTTQSTLERKTDEL